jgi:hypothetical protein
MRDADLHAGGMVEVRRTCGRADQRQRVGGIGNGAVDEALRARLAQQGNMGHRRLEHIENVLDAVGKQLMCEVVGRAVLLPRGPPVMGIGADKERVPFPAQVEADVRVAHQGEQARVLFQRLERFGHEILVLQRDDRCLQPGHLGDPGPIEPACVDHDLGPDRPLGAGHVPFPRRAALDPGDRREAFDLSAQVTRALGQGLCQLAGVDVAFIGVENTAQNRLVGMPERVHVVHLCGAQHPQIIAGAGGHAAQVPEQVHPRFGMGRPERLRVAVGDGAVDLFGQILVHGPRVIARPHAKPGRRIGRDVARRVPGAARGQLIAFQQQRVGHTGQRQVVEDRGANGASADDNDAGGVFHGSVSFRQTDVERRADRGLAVGGQVGWWGGEQFGRPVAGRVPDRARSGIAPVADALAVAQDGIGVFGLHQLQRLRLAEVVSRARGDGFDPVQIDAFAVKLDAAHGAQNCPAHVIVDHQRFARRGHDRGEHADAEVDHVRPGLGGQGDGIALFIACLCVGGLGIGHAC